jgi:hypothetical protein
MMSREGSATYAEAIRRALLDLVQAVDRRHQVQATYGYFVSSMMGLSLTMLGRRKSTMP